MEWRRCVILSYPTIKRQKPSIHPSIHPLPTPARLSKSFKRVAIMLSGIVTLFFKASKSELTVRTFGQARMQWWTNSCNKSLKSEELHLVEDSFSKDSNLIAVAFPLAVPWLMKLPSSNATKCSVRNFSFYSAISVQAFLHTFPPTANNQQPTTRGYTSTYVRMQYPLERNGSFMTSFELQIAF
jgi:hypothetical protein